MNIFRQITANNIRLEDYPFRMELAMEAYLMENESVLKLDRKDFSNPIILDAEIALKEGRKSGDGRIDILAKDRNNNTYAIVELKKDEIGIAALDQLSLYLQQRNRLLSDSEKENKLNWIGILVGKTISQELKNKILEEGSVSIPNSEGNSDVEIDIAAITINRYRSIDHKEIFVVTDTYYSNPNSRDNSKYYIYFGDKKINSKPLSKGALVTEVIRHYVSQNKGIKFVELKAEDKFPYTLQGQRSLGCFDNIEAAEAKRKKHNRSYHRFGSNNEIKLSDTTIVTSNGWALGNIKRFIERANELGYDIKNSSLG